MCANELICIAYICASRIGLSRYSKWVLQQLSVSLKCELSSVDGSVELGYRKIFPEDSLVNSGIRTSDSLQSVKDIEECEG